MHTASHAQEAGSLLEGLGPETRDILEVGTRGEATPLIAERHDGLGQSRTDTGHIAQQGGRSGVHFNPHAVHAAFHDVVEPLLKTRLIHVVLVLADTDALGVDLHQFGQRILQATGDRHRATQRHVEFGKLGAGKIGGRVHRRTSLIHHDHLRTLTADRRVELTHGRLGEILRLTAGGAVADRDQLRCETLQQHPNGSGEPVFLMQIQRVGVEQRARGADHRDLHAGTEARVETDHALLTGR